MGRLKRKYCNPKKLEFATYLRNNMTKAERKMWHMLKASRKNGIGHKWESSVVVYGWIVDFYCYKLKLAIEVDGGYHFTPEQQEKDAYRTKIMNSRGIKVIRFTNEEVYHEIDKVRLVIAKHCEIPIGDIKPVRKKRKIVRKKKKKRYSKFIESHFHRFIEQREKVLNGD